MSSDLGGSPAETDYPYRPPRVDARLYQVSIPELLTDSAESRPLAFEPVSVDWVGEGKEAAAQEFFARAHAHLPSIDEEMARKFLAASNCDVSLAMFKLRCKLGNGMQYKLLQRTLPDVLDQFVNVGLTPSKNKQRTTAEWKDWITSVQRALNNRQKGPSSTPTTLHQLRTLMAEGILVCSSPSQKDTSEGKSLASSLGIDDSICQKAVHVGALLKARIENSLFMVAKCYDCLSGFPKQTLLYCNQVLGEMAVLKIDISAKKHLETIVNTGLEWQKRVRAITMPESTAHVKCSLAELLALAEEGAQMDFSLEEEITFLQVKICEAKHLQNRAQRLLHLDIFAKRRTNASRVHPTRTVLRLFVEQVDAAHVTFPSYHQAKALLQEADQWAAKVEKAFKDQGDSQRVALPQLNSLHSQAVGMRVDLTEELKPVLKKIETAKAWISKVMCALPSRKTRSRADVDKDAHPSLDQLEGLLETAGGMGVNVDRHVGKMSELISSAQNWVTTMRELLSTESSDAADNEDTLNTLMHLLEREKGIPVEIPEARMLSAEVSGRLWSDRVAKLLGLGRFSTAKSTDQSTGTTTNTTDIKTDVTVTKKSAQPHRLRQLLTEAAKVRASVPLPKRELKKWHLRYEDQAKSLMEKYDRWDADANKALKVVKCTPLQQMIELVETAKTLPLSLGKKLEQICDRVKRTQRWEERANQLCEDRLFSASDLKKFCKETTANGSNVGTKATLERFESILTQFESWTKAVEIASRIKMSNRSGAKSSGKSDPSLPSMQTLLDLVEDGEKSFKLLDVSKWMGMLQNKMSIFSSWKEKALEAISRCQDKYYISDVEADAAQRDVYVIIQGDKLANASDQESVRLETISVSRTSDASFSISSADLESHLAKMLEPQTISESTDALAKDEKPTVDATSDSPASHADGGSDGGDDEGVANDSAVAVADGKDRNDVGKSSAVAAANGDSAGTDTADGTGAGAGGDGGGDGDVESGNDAAGTRTRLTNGVFAFTLHLVDGGYLQLAYGDKASAGAQHQIVVDEDVLLFVVVVALDEGQWASVESELSKYDFSAINGKGSSKEGRFDTGCALFSPGFLGERIMTAVNALASDMTTDMEEAIMQGNSININAPELDTLLRLRADSSQAMRLGELFSSRKKIPKKQLREIAASYTRRDHVRSVFDILLPVLGHEVDGFRQWQAKVKLALQKNKAKRPRSDFEELEEEATNFVAEGGDLLKRMKEQLNKSAQLTRRCKICLTKRPPKSEKNIITLIKEGKKLRVLIPELTELQEHVDKSNQWLADLRASGIEEGDASVEELRALLTRSRSIQVDLRVYTKVLEKATVQYCLCRKGTKGFMISCEICNEWYHGECLGVQQRHVSENFKYVCVMCQIIQSTEKSYKVATEILDKVQIDLDNLNSSHPTVISASAQDTSQPNNEQDLLQQHTKSIHLWLQSYRMLLEAPLPRGLGERLKKKKSPSTAETAQEGTAETATDDVEENETPSAKRARKSYSRKARRRTATAKSEADKAATGASVVEDLIDPAQREQEDAQKLERIRKLGVYYDSALEHARRHSVPPYPAPAASALFTTCDPHSPLTVCINIKRWAAEALYHLPRPSSLTLHQLGQLLRFLDMSKTKPYWPVKTISQPIKAIHRRAVKWAESVTTAFKGGASTKMSRLNTLLAKAPSVPFKGAVEDLSSRLLTAIQDGKRYCICRGFNDGSTMICCDECDKWFHVACVKHDPASNAEFSCPKCLMKRQKPQTHKRSHQQLKGQTSRPPLSEPAPPEKRTRKSPEEEGIAQMPALMTVASDREKSAQMPEHNNIVSPKIEAQTPKEEKTVVPAAIAAGTSSLPAIVKVETHAPHKAPKPEPAAPVVAVNVPAPGSAKPSVSVANPVATRIKTPVHPVIAAISPVEAVTPAAAVAPVNSIAPVAALASPINAPVDAIIVPPVNAVPVQSHPVVAQSAPQSTAAPKTQQALPPPQTASIDTQVRADQLRQKLLCMQHFDQIKHHQQRQLEQLQQFHQLQQLQQLHQQIQQQQLQQHMRQQQQLQQQQSEQQQELQKKKSKQ